MRIIKRYRNRRLYDTADSRTITQFDLARMIQEGIDVQVIDSTTGEDITVVVLGRIIQAETSRWRNIKESREFLRAIINTGGEKSMSLLKNTLLASIGILHVTKEKAEKIIDDLIKKGELDKSSRKKAVMELLEKAERSTAQFREKVSKEAGKAQKGVSKLAADLSWAKQVDLKKLQAKVNKLSKQVEELTSKLS